MPNHDELSVAAYLVSEGQVVVHGGGEVGRIPVEG